MAKHILFVCYGNICRSPMAEGVMAKLADGHRLALDSAGISDWHEGEPPDQRAQAICAQHGIDIGQQKSRPVCAEDFDRFDLMLAMDKSNLSALKQMRPKGARAKIELFLSYAPDLKDQEVPDPYYGGQRGFANVLAMIEQAAAGVLRAYAQADR